MNIISKVSNVRLDKYLTIELDMTRSNIINNIKNGNILVNGKMVKSGYNLKENDEISINIEYEDNKLEAENIPLDIVYEDQYLIVVNKKSGMVVHPGAGNKKNTLVNALIYHTNNNLSNINGCTRPGIVHRIDKDTSGLLLISKNNDVHNIIANDFKNKKILRKYIALVQGVIKEENGKIIAPIGRSENDRKKMCVKENGKKAITNFKVIARYKNSTLIECILETGRTHQIRVHMSYIKHPIINDAVYGGTIINDYGQMLHAKYIGFNHPVKNKFLEFEKEPEEEFLNILEMFKNS